MNIQKILAITFFLFFVVACSQAPAQEQATETQPTESVQEQPKEEAQAEAPVAEKPKADTGAKAAFTNAFSGDFAYKADYDLIADAAGKTVTTKLTQYIKVSRNEYKMRMDSTYEGTETRTYVVDSTYTSCTQISGKWNCFTATGSQENNPQQEAQEAAEDETSTVVRDGTMNLAGVQADCYLVTVDNGSSKYCIYDNIPLYVKTMDANGKQISEMKATSYATKVSASDFEPPASSQSMGGYELPPGFEMPQ